MGNEVHWGQHRKNPSPSGQGKKQGSGLWALGSEKPTQDGPVTKQSEGRLWRHGQEDGLLISRSRPMHCALASTLSVTLHARG